LRVTTFLTLFLNVFILQGKTLVSLQVIGECEKLVE
jgi:hypothetical protein